MTAPTPNAELAYRVLDQARQHEAHFNMGTWGWSVDHASVGLDDLTDPADCGTTACLAGWTVALAGYRVDSNARVFSADGLLLEPKVDELAAELLGITEDERERLFFTHDDAVDDVVAEIFGPRPDGGEGGSLTGGES